MFHALWDPFNLPNANLGLCDKRNQPSQDSGVTGGDADNEMDYGQKDQQTVNIFGFFINILYSSFYFFLVT